MVHMISKLFVLTCFLVSSNTNAMTLKVSGGASSNDERLDVHLKILRLLLEKTSAKNEKVKLEIVYHESQKQAANQIESGQIDLAALPIRRTETKSSIHYIPYPVRMGLLGYRYLLVKKRDLTKFGKIKTLEDLQKFTLGYNRTWEDYFVYKDNNIPMLTVSNYKLLLQTLSFSEVDYLSRSIFEAKAELDFLNSKKQEYVAVDGLLLYYPLGDFFYVNKSNDVLFHRLKRGFEIIIKDGSWIKLLKKEFREKAIFHNISNTTLIKLRNKHLREVYTSNLEFWIGREKLQEIIR